MGLVDAFGKDDRIELKVVSVINMIERAARAEAKNELLTNGINCDVPHEYMREMLTGFKKLEAIEDQTADGTVEGPAETVEEPVDDTELTGRPKAVIKKPISADTKWGPVTPEKIELIKQLVREGKTVKAIAEEVGCSDPTVRKYKREMTNEDSLSEILPED